MNRAKAGMLGASLEPNTPLHAYAPGAMAKLTPHQRGRALKRSKQATPQPALTMPRTILR